MAKPEIRLKGFEGEWKKAQISTFCIINPHSSIPYSFEYVDLESVVGTKIVSHRTEMLDTAPSRAQRLAKDGDIFYQTVRPYQKNNCIYRDMGQPYVFSTGYAQIRTNINPNFLFNVLQSDSFVNKVLLDCTGTSYPAINPTKLSQIEVDFSGNEEEQKALANYFSSLDSLLQSTTKKIESLKQMKQACLVSMFPQTGETTPRVRFKGFEGKWENKELSDCLEISNERNFDNKYDKEDVLSVSDDFGVMNQIELLGRSYAGKSVSNYGILKQGELVYTKSPLKSKPFGIVKENTGETGIVSVLYAIYRAKEGYWIPYFHYYFDPAWRLNAYLRPLINKGAKNTMNISDETALTGYIMVPKDIKEQQCIASYFRSLDKQISLQEQRLEKLKQIKAACLDKMFV